MLSRLVIDQNYEAQSRAQLRAVHAASSPAVIMTKGMDTSLRCWSSRDAQRWCSQPLSSQSFHVVMYINWAREEFFIATLANQSDEQSNIKSFSQHG